MSYLESSFLQEIARQPHAWLPRLIYADWLEEQGDPRSELIRLSHQLTRLACEDRQRKEARLQELCAAGVVWPSPSPANHLNLQLTLIPPGEFRMGSPDWERERGPDEKPVNVTVTRGFWLAQCQVTQAAYHTVMGHNPSYFNRDELGADTGNHPVEQVTWAQAMEFCTDLTAAERTARRLPSSWEYTLPTEAQWEYACRAGTTTATACGNSLSSTRANFNGLSPYGDANEGEFPGRTVAVGSYRPNAWNLTDMHGNVWEWCRDWYADKLPGGTDPELQAEGTNRVIRGGSWVNRGWYCRSANRNWYTPVDCDNTLGFRVALVERP